MKLPLLLCLLIAPVWADGFREEFEKTKASGGHTEIAKLLELAKERERDNPDYYALASNYWWGFAMQPNLSTKPAVQGETSIHDQKTGKEVGSISTNGELDPQLKVKAEELTAEGFRRFPTRLDLGFGLAWVQFQRGRKEDAVLTIGKILDVAREKPNELKWTANGPLPEPAVKFIPESIQGYTAPLFREETPKTDALCRTLCEATIKAYPDHPFAYNMLAALADAAGNKPEAIRLLKVAHEKAPADTLILFNLAEAYRAAKLTKEATSAYQKLLTMDLDEESKAQVNQALKELGLAKDSR